MFSMSICFSLNRPCEKAKTVISPVQNDASRIVAARIVNKSGLAMRHLEWSGHRGLQHCHAMHPFGWLRGLHTTLPVGQLGIGQRCASSTDPARRPFGGITSWECNCGVCVRRPAGPPASWLHAGKPNAIAHPRTAAAATSRRMTLSAKESPAASWRRTSVPGDICSGPPQAAPVSSQRVRKRYHCRFRRTTLGNRPPAKTVTFSELNPMPSPD
jgi:hypothetical protein